MVLRFSGQLMFDFDCDCKSVRYYYYSVHLGRLQKEKKGFRGIGSSSAFVRESVVPASRKGKPMLPSLLVFMCLEIVPPAAEMYEPEI